MTYLPDDVLTKVDRASMAVSLETRAPFLDRGVLEAAWRLPDILEGARRDVQVGAAPGPGPPRPAAHWSTGRRWASACPWRTGCAARLRPWAEDLLSPAALARHGLLAAAPVRRAWKLHSEGKRDLSYELWDVLVLQSWLERWSSSGAS